MTNKEAEVYFRDICRGDKANSEIDFTAFARRVGVDQIQTDSSIVIPDLTPKIDITGVTSVSNPFEKK